MGSRRASKRAVAVAGPVVAMAVPFVVGVPAAGATAVGQGWVNLTVADPLVPASNCLIPLRLDETDSQATATIYGAENCSAQPTTTFIGFDYVDPAGHPQTLSNQPGPRVVVPGGIEAGSVVTAHFSGSWSPCTTGSCSFQHDVQGTPPRHTK